MIQDNNANILVDTKLNAEYIYDFTLHQTYSKLSGFLVNLSGLSVFIIAGIHLRNGNFSLKTSLLLVAVGICILAYTPIHLFISAKKYEKYNKYNLNIRYSFDRNGITKEYSKSPNTTVACSTYLWKDLLKVVSTPKTIAYFINDNNAYVIPKQDFRNNFLKVMKLTFDNMSHEKIYIR
jgi:hypothetical protein